jgi:sigma-B regulation protein RsbU (phosphoserine phosphatase)
VGETLFCYSDGVTEAEDADGTLLSEDGCLDWLGCNGAATLPALLDALFERVVEHTGTRMMADDCTMLAVRRTARS